MADGFSTGAVVATTGGADTVLAGEDKGAFGYKGAVEDGGAQRASKRINTANNTGRARTAGRATWDNRMGRFAPF